jgi:hypothetical protein
MQQIQPPSDGTPLELTGARLRYFENFFFLMLQNQNAILLSYSMKFLGIKIQLRFLEKLMTSLG